jgi:2,3-bisphosphoglycerate-dependent phosphoglycerate mutase
MQTLIVARHGESEYSARGLLNGDPAVEVGLTEAGEEQARTLGLALEATPLALCVVTELGRTRRTAELALAGRDIPFEIWPELNDPRSGVFEGGSLAEYRGWAWAAGSAEPAPGGGESRRELVARYARAYRALLASPQRTMVAVVHALPIAYLLGAIDGQAPAARMDRPVEYARAYVVDGEQLRAAVELLEAWCALPTW